MKIAIFQSFLERQCADWKIIVKLWPNCTKSSFYPLKLHSYWTHVHQIFTQCSWIVTTLSF